MKNKNGKKSYKLLYIIGTTVLLCMLAVSSVNFFRDSRLLELPVLSKETGSNGTNDKSEASSDFKTIKYKKPDESKKKGSGNSKAKTSSKATSKPETKVTPVPTAEP